MVHQYKIGYLALDDIRYQDVLYTVWIVSDHAINIVYHMIFSALSKPYQFLFCLCSMVQVPLTRWQCFLLVSAGSLSHFFLDHLFEVILVLFMLKL